ncbi:MAG: hypothetical protein OSB00_10240 [Sphingomonas bacterium]|nr:hypothetical protein [Sphingomonas bacterium]
MIARLAVILALSLPLMAARSDPLAGRIAGEPQQCLNLSLQTTSPVIEDGNTIVYRQSGRRWWVTHPVGGCGTLRPLATLIVEPFGNRLCENDRFRTIIPGQIIPSAYCRFGPFTPYDKPSK